MTGKKYENVEISSYLGGENSTYRCPKCGTEIPENIIICWSCGKCLSWRIEKLYGETRDEGKDNKTRRRRTAKHD